MMKPRCTAIETRAEIVVEPRRMPSMAIRLAVLQRQISRFSDYRPDPRLPLKKEYVRALVRATCNMCADALETVEFDHILPLNLGGRTAVDNLQALCRACHKVKCRADIRIIAKAKRQKRAAELGRGRKPKGKIAGSSKTMQSRPFQKRKLR